MRYPPIVPNYPRMLHGGDYNPDQWQDRPDVLEEDIRLARLAGVNSFSLAIFAWAALEPAEGRFEFGWLDRILDRMAAEGMKAVLATPSGAKPNWMAAKYPEIRRVGHDGRREPQQGRHNHCPTSPVYREKVTLMNGKLAERYARHEALGVWHLSNEYNGECRCELCKAAFRAWLQRRHGTLAKLNAAWWTAFWAHTYTDWSQVDALDGSVHGLILDWKRFVTEQTTDFMKTEIAPLRQFTPTVPVTTNMMGVYLGLDYRRMARELDVISWDNYPALHDRGDTLDVACSVSFAHDLNRGLKGGRPFMMMESSPSATNWMGVNKLLRPGVHRLKSLQAVAHGADTVQYFQYRKSRGSTEKFHGAVVDHVGTENTRVFREVAQVGEALEKLRGVVGCPVPAEVALVYDWENRWVLNEIQGPPKAGNNGWVGSALFESWVQGHYRAFWQRGIAVDVVGQQDDLSRYKLVIAPMLYMLQPGMAERLEAFVRQGGTLVGTFLTGIADENDLVFLGGWPGPLRPLFGIWAEEIDYLYPDEANALVLAPGNALGLGGPYAVTSACDLIHAESAEVLATYGDDFYAGRPCLTVNRVGQGQAFYLACRAEDRFLADFYAGLEASLGLKRALAVELPKGVTATVRTDGKKEYVFVLNFTREAQEVAVGDGVKDVLAGGAVTSPARLDPYGVRVFERPAKRA